MESNTLLLIATILGIVGTLVGTYLGGWISAKAAWKLHQSKLEQRRVEKLHEAYATWAAHIQEYLDANLHVGEWEKLASAGKIDGGSVGVQHYGDDHKTAVQSHTKLAQSEVRLRLLETDHKRTERCHLMTVEAVNATNLRENRDAFHAAGNAVKKNLYEFLDEIAKATR